MLLVYVTEMLETDVCLSLLYEVDDHARDQMTGVAYCCCYWAVVGALVAVLMAARFLL